MQLNTYTESQWRICNCFSATIPVLLQNSVEFVWNDQNMLTYQQEKSIEKELILKTSGFISVLYTYKGYSLRSALGDFHHTHFLTMNNFHHLFGC